MASQNLFSDLNDLIKAHTAFQGWDDLRAALATGYTPTIYKPKKGDEQRLVRMLAAMGVKVYTGK